MKWITRERRKIDRIACPWLILRFVEPNAECLYVPADKVLATAQDTGAIPYDIPVMELSHAGERCSFDAFLAKYQLTDSGLQRLALNDHKMLRHGFIVYNTLYAWRAELQSESHVASGRLLIGLIDSHLKRELPCIAE